MPGSKVLHAQARETIYEVYKYMKDEAEYGVKNVKQVRSRVAAATNVSVQTVYRIVKEGRAIDSQQDKTFVTPGLRRNRPKTKTAKISEDLLNLAIISHREAFNEYPTVKQLHEMLKEEGHFTGVKSTLSNLLRSFGFKMKRISPKKCVIYEKKKCPHGNINRVLPPPAESTIVLSKLNNTVQKIANTVIKVENEDENSHPVIERVDIKQEMDEDNNLKKQNGFDERLKIKCELDEEGTETMQHTGIERFAMKNSIDLEIPFVKQESYHHELMLETDPCEFKQKPIKSQQDHDYC